MQKVCFLIGNINHSGGTERVTTLIANHLTENYQVFILSIDQGDNPFFELNPKVVNQYLFSNKVSMKKHYFSAVKKIRSFILENKIDTLIVVDSISCVFTVPACMGLNVNHICWEHFNLKVNLGTKFRDLGRWMAARWCNRIITLTERDKAFWDAKFKLDANKVIAIPNPSPYELQNNIPQLLHKRILCVGRLTYQKGFDLLVQSWSKVYDQLDGWKIIVVGSGEDESMLRLQAQELGVSDSILFVGQQKDMDKFYREASFFCMSSRFEGLPMVLLEAQSYGLPIVSFDCDTGPAEIINNDINGILVESFNVDKFAFNLKKMAQIDSSNFSEMIVSSKKFSTKFHTSKIVNIWVKSLNYD